jgi:ring-1,2-phenylacetyl-CoA epoxidase subunit PaaD
MSELALADIWRIIDGIMDPEIPIISVVELGIVREVQIDRDGVDIAITPTFSGCPAFQAIQAAIKENLEGAGVGRIRIRVRLAPPWSTDWISPEGRQKLKEFGLAPPPQRGNLLQIDQLMVARCPYCDSEDTLLKNSFGSTLCRAIYFCNTCQQPFEQFKPV